VSLSKLLKKPLKALKAPTKLLKKLPKPPRLPGLPALPGLPGTGGSKRVAPGINQALAFKQLRAQALIGLPAPLRAALARAPGVPIVGSTQMLLLDRERLLKMPPAMQPPPAYSDVELPYFDPTPARTVFGVEHTPLPYATLQPPGYSSDVPTMPYLSETEETAWPDATAIWPDDVEGDAYDDELDPDYDEGDPWSGADENYSSGYADDGFRGPSFDSDTEGAFVDSLSGMGSLYDVVIGDPIAFWRQKWAESKAKLSNAIVSMAGTRNRLARARATMNAMLDAASSTTTTPATGTELVRLQQKLRTLEDNQADLEGKAKAATQQFDSIAQNNPDAGLGIWPFVAAGAVIAAVVGIVAAVVIHTQSVGALEKELDLVASKKLTAAELAKIKNAGGLVNVGVGFGGVAALALVGLGLYLYANRKRAA
jgi:hypothetical protein